MSRKLNYIPRIDSYEDIKQEMSSDLAYRLEFRGKKTSLGRPLYYRINTQLILTEECPYSCPFCLERQNPMAGNNNFEAQIDALKKVLLEHPDARLTITGGEPGLYPKQVETLVHTFKTHSKNVFVSINTAGFSKKLNGLAHINLSVNDYVKPNPIDFPGCTIQTVMKEDEANIEFIKRSMQADTFNHSFRFMSDMQRTEYDVSLWNELQKDDEIIIHTFRIGDFFVYATFDYRGRHARVTLGDMWQQQHNDYRDGYSNIIIHPDGTIRVNWR